MISKYDNDVPAGLVVDREPALPGLDVLSGTGGRALAPETAVSLPDRGEGNGEVVPRPTVYVANRLLVNAEASHRQVKGRNGEDVLLVQYLDEIARDFGWTLTEDDDYPPRQTRLGEKPVGLTRYTIEVRVDDRDRTADNSSD